MGVSRHELSGVFVNAQLVLIAVALNSVPASAQAGEVRGSFAGELAPAPPAATLATRPPPARLSIAVVTPETSLPTFEQRVSSWFTDGTQVSVRLEPVLDQERLLASAPGEVSVWVVPLAPDRALVTFSSTIEQGPPPGPLPARHLVREVRLRNGLDDLGMERLASVIHSAFVALREGAEGFEREQAERELAAAGLLPTASNPSQTEPFPPPQPPPVSPAPSLEPRPSDSAGPPPVASGAASKPGASWLVAAGYGGRARGSEGLAHGPSLTLGAQLPGVLSPIDLLLSGQFLFRSTFEAGSLDASVQTSVLRAQAGLEPRLSRSLRGLLLIGAGVDAAQIRSSVGASLASEETARIEPRRAGTQWRGAGQVVMGLWWSSGLLDLGLSTELTFLLGDVHYSLSAKGREQRLATPWLVQPGLSVQARFRDEP